MERGRFDGGYAKLSKGSLPVLHHNLIIVENLSPVLSPQEREKRKQEITKSLYEVFKKYSDNHKSNRS